MKQSNKVISGLFWAYLESISAQLISFAVTVVLARLLEPSHYGTIALLTVFIALAQVFVTGGISSSLIQKKDADELDYSTMFWFNLAVSLFLYGILFFCAPLIARYYHLGELSTLLRVLSLSIPLSAFNCIQQAYVSSHMVFKKSFISNSGSTLLSGIVGIAMAFAGLGVWALVAQRILYVVIGTILLKLVVDWKPQLIFSFERLKPMLSFGWKMMVTGFLFTGYSELRSLIIGKRYSAADLGYYDRGYSFPKLIAGNIDSTINRVLFPALSNEQDALGHLADKTRRAAKTSAFVMTPLFWLLALIAHPLVLILLGAKWLPCVPFLQIMCLSWWLQPTQTCSLQAIKAIGRSDIYLKAEIFNKMIGLSMLAYAVFVVNSVMAIALTMLMAQFVAMVVYGICSMKYVGYQLKEQFTDLLLPVLYSLPMCLFAYFIPAIITNRIGCVIIQIVGGGVLFVTTSIICKSESLQYITRTIGIKVPLRKVNRKKQ